MVGTGSDSAAQGGHRWAPSWVETDATDGTTSLTLEPAFSIFGRTASSPQGKAGEASPARAFAWSSLDCGRAATLFTFTVGPDEKGRREARRKYNRMALTFDGVERRLSIEGLFLEKEADASSGPDVAPAPPSPLQPRVHNTMQPGNSNKDCGAELR